MRHDKATGPILPSPERQLAGLIDKWEPESRKIVKSMRRILRKRFLTANELVYDYTQSLVISYSPNERGSDAIVAVSVGADGVRLFFNHGPDLPDPQGLLRGKGRQTRYIQIEAADVLRRPEVQSLLTAALNRITIPFATAGRAELILKSSKKGRK